MPHVVKEMMKRQRRKHSVHGSPVNKPTTVEGRRRDDYWNSQKAENDGRKWTTLSRWNSSEENLSWERNIASHSVTTTLMAREWRESTTFSWRGCLKDGKKEEGKHVEGKASYVRGLPHTCCFDAETWTGAARRMPNRTATTGLQWRQIRNKHKRRLPHATHAPHLNDK